MHQESFNAQWVDATAGDLNADGADDLSLVRNISQGEKLLKTFNGRTWAALAEHSYDFSWLALAAGNLTSSYSGDELALTRSGVLGYYDSLVLLHAVSGTYADVITDPNYKYYPYFSSLATGDLNGDGDDEILLLRDPTQATTSLLAVNPAGVAMRTFEQAIGYGSTAWKLVRTGDTDGDGRDEVVVERGDVYRIYTAPESNDSYSDTTGSLYTTAALGNLPTMAVGNIDGLGVLLGPVLSVSPASQSFSLEYGQTSPIKTFSITNTGTAEAIAWQAQVTEGATWLRLDKTGGTTPGTLGISVNTAAVVPGSYTGKIHITATSSSGTVSSSPQDVTVSLTLTGVAMVVSPTSLSFSVSYGQTSPVKPVTISSPGGASPIQWQADVLEGTDWLILSASQGTSPSTINVSVNTLAVVPGNRTGTIRIRALDSQVSQGLQYVTISLTVQDSGLVVTPEQLVIRQKAGGPAQVHSISIVRPGWNVQWVATALPTANAVALLEKLASGKAEVSATGMAVDGEAVSPPSWLSFTPDQGSTPATMSVSLQTSVPGIYRAMIVIVAVDPTVPNRVHTVDVTGYVVGSFNYAPLMLK
ncbi:MAG: VCBS repeat-containing protein [Chloroflexi bacterium]|nr:VCBS repeat-containing protein [Chloroflexota bacterium]